MMQLNALVTLTKLVVNQRLDVAIKKLRGDRQKRKGGLVLSALSSILLSYTVSHRADVTCRMSRTKRDE